MARGKAKKVKKVNVLMSVPAKPKKAAEPNISKELKEIENTRNAMIEDIRPKLLSKEALKRGGSGIRARNLAEQGYISNMTEINKLGAKLGLRPIGLGHLRKN